MKPHWQFGGKFTVTDNTTITPYSEPKAPWA